jgi:hypothetical protein
LSMHTYSSFPLLSLLFHPSPSLLTRPPTIRVDQFTDPHTFCLWKYPHRHIFMCFTSFLGISQCCQVNSQDLSSQSTLQVPILSSSEWRDFFFFYSYVHTRLGSFLPTVPTPALTTHSAPPLNTQQKLFCSYF